MTKQAADSHSACCALLGYDSYNANQHSQGNSNAFEGFRTSPHSPFLDIGAQHSGMADIFPEQAASLQPATSQAASIGLSHHWSSASGSTAPAALFDHSRSLDIHPGG